jgi:hypothetical protein
MPCSVASPVVAGAVALLLSSMTPPLAADLLTPAAVKTALLRGARRVAGANIFEQGASGTCPPPNPRLRTD